MFFLKNQWGPLLVMGSLTFLSACNDSANQTSDLSQHKTSMLATATVEVKSLPVHYQATGSIVSDQRIDIASRTSAYIRKILVNEGDQVVKDQLLVELDGSDVEGAVNQALALVNKAKTALTDAETDFDRFEALFSRGSVSENTLRKIKLQRDVAQDSLRQANVSLKTAQSQRQYIQITSPITGVVVERKNREGGLASPAMPILTIESSKGLLFETYIAEGQIEHINQNDVVQVKIDAISQILQGTVVRIVPSGDPVTRKSLIKIALPDNTKLLPGMFGRTKFTVGSKSAPVINADSLITKGGLKGVFIIDELGYAHFRWLRLGKQVDNEVEILVGLKGGERVVIKPDDRLRDGDLIKDDAQGLTGE